MEGQLHFAESKRPIPTQMSILGVGTTGNTPSLDHEQIILLKAVDRDHTPKLHDFYLCNSTMKSKRLFTTDPHGP